MSEDAIRSVCDPASNPDWPSPPPLCASPLDPAVVSNELEHDLRAMVTEHRRVFESVKPMKCNMDVVQAHALRCALYMLKPDSRVFYLRSG